MNTLDAANLDYWERRSRARAGGPYQYPPPLRPADSDLARYEEWARRLRAAHEGASFEVLMLGMTRGIAAMRWPEGISLLAVDWSPGMIERFWPEESAPRGAQVMVADWRAQTLAVGSRDMAIGDTCYAALATLKDCAALNASVARALRPGGHWLLRCFLRPEAPEPLAGILQELHAGRIGVFEIFCWRLAMALHGGDGEGVRRDDVWREWHAAVVDPCALCERLGWDPRVLAAVERWQGEATRILFPSLAEVRRLIDPYFELAEMRYPDYEMGDRCPMLVLRRR